MNPPSPPKAHHRIFYLFVVLVIFGLWRLFHRDDTHAWPLPAEPWSGEGVGGRDETSDTPARAPADAPRPPADADPLADLARVLGQGAEPRNGAAVMNGDAPANGTSETAFEHRYTVKWTDRSQGVSVPHEKRNLTLRQAMRDAGWIAQHARRFYSGADSARSPFAELRVYLQCLCGRDVPDLTKAHTIPGEDRVCPYSGQSAEATSAQADPSQARPVSAAR